MGKRINKSKILIIVMFFIGVFGIILLSYDYINSKIRLTFETVNLELNGNNPPKVINEGSEEEKEILAENKQDGVNQTVTQNKNGSVKYNTSIYFGYISIPKINLVQGLVKMDSKRNNVRENIQTIKPSDYPDVENGNLILAAHSGSSSIAYFKKLYLLNVNDQVNVIYNNQTYVYNIVNIYTVPKNGKVAIYRNPQKTCITLITCTKNDNTTQSVYIGELVRKEGV